MMKRLWLYAHARIWEAREHRALDLYRNAKKKREKFFNMLGLRP